MPDSTDRAAGAQPRKRVALARVHDHPSNPNVMSDDRLEQLTARIDQSGRYPPLIVRNHPERDDHYQLLDGHQRARVLRSLGHTEAEVVLWECSDDEALQLLVTLNRLSGDDDEARSEALLDELLNRHSPADLEALLPAGDERLSALIDELSSGEAGAREVQPQPAAIPPDALRRVSFTLSTLEAEAIETKLELLAAELGLLDARRRGRALAALCRVGEQPDA